ncbi:MAG: lipopolysaccharide assembly protein LapA domain-containing protein [Alphaproteobacteria bacterium]|nr:lipopolysaccharide assembly protein LapA domain-containing protein [Alphaproteobacteria bacterium]MDP6831761.1 lipopolysaccharide assembly protein LapA domain-containing protein [Alphaproteobacteria bacterium]MDP6874963.1 lipopolysaccharide assembly protein LapA domain-containing protein [Alphaproteobacteria bacterium]
MKLLLWLLLLPLILIFVAFAVANRHGVTLSLDPTPLSIEAPLYGLVFAGIFVGLIAGGLIAWIRGGRTRRLLREQQRTVRRLEGELQKVGNLDATAEQTALSEGETGAVGKAA